MSIMLRIAYDTETHDLLTPALVALSTLQYHHRLIRDKFIKIQFESMKCVIVFGRSVFHAIDGTRAFKRELVPINDKFPEFSIWWEEKKKIMRNDQMIEELRRLRNHILKEGTIDCRATMSKGPIICNGNVIGASDAPELSQFSRPIIGTQYGGMVWECIRSDGVVEYFPAKLPAHTIFEYKLHNKEMFHLGKRYINPTLRQSCDLYLHWCEIIVMELLKNYKKRT